LILTINQLKTNYKIQNMVKTGPSCN